MDSLVQSLSIWDNVLVANLFLVKNLLVGLGISFTNALVPKTIVYQWKPFNSYHVLPMV